MFKYLIKRTKDLVKEIHNEELALQKGLVPLVSRDIDEVIVHCTDSSVKKHDKFLKYFLYKWHVLERKWSDY
ncbi:MAG: hypothetical protein K0U41_06255, partial [Gammaproteobacteria bacterium]|nr:hypothetical protein [Gammaproteobacteria bacterium]